MEEMWERAIAHVDMDAFFANVEVRDAPELRGRPVAVGGTGPRGVISTANYEARAFGVRSALPTGRALALCPQLILLPGRHGHYRDISEKVMAVLDTFSPIREAVSVDEAYLDITGSQRLFGPPEQIAVAIRQAVWDAVRLTCSVGVGVSKSVAKIASGHQKPHGIIVVPPDTTREFLAPLPIGAIGGVGPEAQKKCANFGIVTVGDLAELPIHTARRIAGSGADALLALARGVDPRPVGSAPKDRSIGKERTFDLDISDSKWLRAIATEIADDVSHRLRLHALVARSVSVKMRAPDGRTITRSLTLAHPTANSEEFRQRALAAFERAHADVRRVRLLGIRAEHVQPASGIASQADLSGVADTWSDLDQAMDRARAKFGRHSLSRAAGLSAGRTRAQDGTDNALEPGHRARGDH